ncbi:MAG: hypothetical protein WA174_04265 [Rhodoferax sp.]
MLVLGAVAWAFGHQVRVVQGMGERAAVQSTLGAVRTALVVDRVHASVLPADAARQRNPFLLLRSVPVNYAGDVVRANMGSVAPGSWVFDPDCVCIGYRLLYPQWLESSAEPGGVWFRIGSTAGPLQVTPLEQYRWQGVVVD